MRSRWAIAAAGIALAACSTPVNNDTVSLSSDAFEDGGAMPSRYTCDGADVSPPLAWATGPDEVGAYALVVRDADAGGFVHWVLTDIPHDVTTLPEGQGDSVGIPGRTTSAASVGAARVRLPASTGTSSGSTR